jgi:membrane peptidoglycan carboxypeptidase
MGVDRCLEAVIRPARIQKTDDDPYFGQVNEAAAVQLNMGSTTKLFTYTAAIASTKFTMTTKILDSYYKFPIPGSAPYSPYDDDRRTHGVCELKMCIGNSFNRALASHAGRRARCPRPM